MEWSEEDHHHAEVSGDQRCSAQTGGGVEGCRQLPSLETPEEVELVLYWELWVVRCSTVPLASALLASLLLSSGHSCRGRHMFTSLKSTPHNSHITFGRCTFSRWFRTF